MPPSLDTLEAEALKLSAEERAQLADHLLARLSDGGDVEDAWAAEVERRIAAAERGDVSFTPADQAIARARQALK